MELVPIPYFAITMSLLVAPALTFGFIYLMRRKKVELEKIRYQKEILELEVEKEEIRLKAMIEENRKYDRLIEDRRAP
jgi:hypothetical protein